MKVGVIGSGVVAQTLGAGFLRHGHQVALGTRGPAKLEAWGQKNPGAQILSFAEAAAFGELVVLAVGGEVALEALALVGGDAIAGKTVIDACNPIGGGPPVNGVLSFFTTFHDSLMERLQKAYPDAHFVKAFNSVGAGQMVNPHFAAGRPTMFICGESAAAKATVTKFSISSAGIPRTWGRSKPRALLSRYACCGASRASARATGPRMRSSCCADGLSRDARVIATIRHAHNVCSILRRGAKRPLRGQPGYRNGKYQRKVYTEQRAPHAAGVVARYCATKVRIEDHRQFPNLSNNVKLVIT